MARRTAIVVLATCLGIVACPDARAAATPCPTRLDPTTLVSAATLHGLNAREWSYGPRPTGSPAHRRMVAWLERELRRVPGLHVTGQGYRIDAWAPGAASLRMQAGGRTLTLPVAAPVPYSRATAAAGASAPLVHVPEGQRITAANAAGGSSSATRRPVASRWPCSPPARWPSPSTTHDTPSIQPARSRATS